MGSLIYKDLFFYRLMMNLLYSGSYRKRFTFIYPLVRATSLLELCFADTVLAGWCHGQQIRWTGFDINGKFVNCAKKKGYNAYQADLKNMKELPPADVCVMAGSLYHFYGMEEFILSMMLTAAPQVIISEPVRNLFSAKGIPGKLLRKWAGDEDNPDFRYDAVSFWALLENMSGKLGFRYEVKASFKKDMIVMITR